MRTELALGAAAVLALAAGCAPKPTLHSAFDDITNEARAAQTELVTFRQLISLNGLMPLHVPGVMFFEPGLSSVSGVRESPALLVGVSPKRSKVVEARYEVEEPKKRVAELQQGYLKLRAAALAAVAARARHALLRQLELEGASAESRKLVAGALGLEKEAPTKADVDALRKEVDRKLGEAEGKLAAAQAKYNEDLADNVVLVRWTKKNQFSGLAGMFKIFRAAVASDSEESGVLILAGLRVLNAYFGEDLYCMIENTLSNDQQRQHLKRTSVTVNLIQARAVGYVSDIDVASSLAASLRVSKAQLKDLIDKGLLAAAADDAELTGEMLVASAMNASNVGRLGTPKISDRKIRLFPAERYAEEIEEEVSHADGYVTVSVTRVQFSDALLGALARAAGATNCDEELEPRRTAYETLARTLRKIENDAAAAVNGIDRLPSKTVGRVETVKALYGAIARARGVRETCAEKLRTIDGRVEAALSDLLNGGTAEERRGRRATLKISEIERERDTRPILAQLNALENWTRDGKRLVQRVGDRTEQDPDALAKFAHSLGAVDGGDLKRVCGAARAG